jgi:hypothetical protein
MSDPAPPRPAPGDLRGYLLTQFNQALRRLGMYGGEDALLLLADALAFADACQPEWNETIAELQAHGAATSARVRGAFQRLWGDQGPNPHDAVASIYAEVALPRGWVTLDHALDRREYDELDQSSAPWAGQDRTLTGVLATYGPPSIWFGGTNPYYPKTLGYTTAPTAPTADGGPHSLICFHLWNRPQPAAAPRRAVHDEPILLAVRHPSHPGPGHHGPGSSRPFADRFTFTPAGARHRHPEY